MRIGIDARLWEEAGVGRYIRNLVFELSKIDQQNEYFLLLLKKNLGQKLPQNFHQVEADFRWYSFAEQRKLPKLLNFLKLDLVHFSHFNVPIFYSGKYVVTIHDLIHQHHKMRRATTLNPLIYQFKHYAYNFALKTALKKSQKIITVSNFVKKQLIEEMKVSPDKIEVTYEAVDDKILSIVNKMSQTKISKILNKLQIKTPFIFYVGNAHPHKNVEGLIKAFKIVTRVKSLESGQNKSLTLDPSNLRLVLTGHDHYFWERIKQEFQNQDIIYTGYITDEEMVALYKNAQVFVMPSFEEGFGIPILESMACGCPVVSSNAGSLPEVGGNAAIYFDPSPRHSERSEESLTMEEAITKGLSDQKLRKQLIEKGEKRYKEFSWKKLAEQTLKIYKTI